MWIRQVLVGWWLMKMVWPVRAAAWIWRRLMFRTTFIAISGSLGKTTSKELLTAILKPHGRTYATIGNQNGPHFVALNILRVRPWHRYAVLEVAGAAPGMMQRIAHVVRPDVAVLLTIRRTHSTNFESLDEHAREKQHLIRAASQTAKVVLNGDDPRIATMAAGPRQTVIRFGVSEGCRIRASRVESAWPGRLVFDATDARTRVRVQTQLCGEHWLAAALGGLAAAAAVGVPIEVAAVRAAAAAPFRGRLQPVRLPCGAIVLRDDYNASLDGTQAAFEVMRNARAARRVLVISDLSDFGGNRKRRLRYIAAQLPSIAEMAVFVGESVDYAVNRAVEAGVPAGAVCGFPTPAKAAEFLRGELREGDLVLLKGRTTDHIARIFFAQFAEVACWKAVCSKTRLCDECWELGADAGDFERIRLVEAPAGEPAK